MSNIRLRSLISAFFLQCLLICCDQVAVPEREVSHPMNGGSLVAVDSMVVIEAVHGAVKSSYSGLSRETENGIDVRPPFPERKLSPANTIKSTSPQQQFQKRIKESRHPYHSFRTGGFTQVFAVAGAPNTAEAKPSKATNNARRCIFTISRKRRATCRSRGLSSGLFRVAKEWR